MHTWCLSSIFLLTSATYLRSFLTWSEWSDWFRSRPDTRNIATKFSNKSSESSRQNYGVGGKADDNITNILHKSYTS